MTNGTSVSVELIHSPNHVVVIPKEDVIAGLAKMYTLQDNGSGHTHQITLTMDDFARLQTAQGIQVTSTVNNHAHLVTVNCA